MIDPRGTVHAEERRLKTIWIILCTIAGIAIGAGLLGGVFNSWPLAAVGGVVGAVPGWLFGRFVPMHAVLTDLFG